MKAGVTTTTETVGDGSVILKDMVGHPIRRNQQRINFQQGLRTQ
jgi:hypothetical protein